MSALVRYGYQAMHAFVQQVFVRLDFSVLDGALAATALLRADLRGISSHGLIRLPNYVHLIQQKRINPCPKLRVVQERLATACIDADQSLGAIASTYAMEQAIAKAQQVGAAWVVVRNSNHFGIAAQYSMQALPHGLIGVAMTHATPLVAPSHGKARQLGTNPISIAIPAQDKPPLVIDMATAQGTSGKVEEIKRQGKNTPPHWLQDAAGQASIDPYALEQGGALLPMGADASHKGYCLSAWVDIFSGVLSGANFGPWVPPFVHYLQAQTTSVGKGLGHAFAAIDPRAFVDNFYSQMDKWISTFEQTPSTSGQPVRIPGEIEYQNEKQNLQEGLPFSSQHWEGIQALAHALDLPLPDPC